MQNVVLIFNFNSSFFLHTLPVPISQTITDETLRAVHGEAAYKIVERLTDAGFDTWWVGGSVRDMLRGHVPKDIDIATDARPDEVQQLFPRSKSLPAAYGSVRVPMGKQLFEVTTFREDDTASDGRRPHAVTFSHREMDAQRRDFTVNALYFQPISRQLYDPFQGEVDLKESLIRFIGDPQERMKHDALRILRAIRFRALLNGQYHPDTYHALQASATLIDVLSGQRLMEELEKMLRGPYPARALEDLRELQLLQRFLPELAECRGIPQPADYHHEGDVWEHTLQCARSFMSEHGPDVRLATLFHDSGKVKTFSLKGRIRFDHHATESAKIAENALARLQLPMKRREKISWLIAHHMMMGTFVDASVSEERKAHWFHHPWFPELLQLFWLDIAGTDPADYSLFDRIVTSYHRFLDAHPRKPKPLLSGEDIMKLFSLKPGEEVGRLLQVLHTAQLKGDISSRKEASAFLKEQVEHLQKKPPV